MTGRATVLAVSALVVLGPGCAKTETEELSTRGLYAVFEVIPVHGTAPKGSRLGPVRVMVVDSRLESPAAKQLEDAGFPTSCPAPPSLCDSVAFDRGGIVLRSPGTHLFAPETLDAWEIGDERVLRGTELRFTTLHQGPVLTLSGPEDEPAEARVKLMMKCDARILQVKHSGDLNARGEHSWIEVARPRCFSALDNRAETPSLEPRAGAHTEAQTFHQERRVAIERAASEWARAHPAESPGWEALSPLERKLNPTGASLMHAGQLTQLSFEFRCLKKRTRTRGWSPFKIVRRRGGDCKNSGHVLVVEWTGGVRQGVNRSPRDTGAWSEERTAETLAELFERVWIDEQGWLRIDRPGRFDRPARSWVTEPPEEKVIDELLEMLTFLAVHVPPPGDPAHERLPRPESWSFTQVSNPENDEEE